MRTLKLRFPNDTLPTLDIFLKQTTEAASSPCPSRARGRQRPAPPNRVRYAALYLFRPAQVAEFMRFAHQGTRGLVDHPLRSGRPPAPPASWNNTWMGSSIKSPLQHGCPVFSMRLPS